MLLARNKSTRITTDLQRLLSQLTRGKAPVFADLAPESKQIVKFLVQPQVSKLPQLGPFRSLILEVIEMAPLSQTVAPGRQKRKPRFECGGPRDASDERAFFESVGEDTLHEVEAMLAKDSTLIFEVNERLQTAL